MSNLSLAEIVRFFEAHASSNDHRLARLREIDLYTLLQQQNTYFYILSSRRRFRADEFLSFLIEPYFYSIDFEFVGNLLTRFAIFVSEKTHNGIESLFPGIDLEFEDADVKYLVIIRHEPSWSDTSLHSVIWNDFQKAILQIKEGQPKLKIQPVLGVSCGYANTVKNNEYYVTVGQNFWHLLSRQKELYTNLAIALTQTKRQFSHQFLEERDKLINRLTRELLMRFSKKNGELDWFKLIQIQSGRNIE